MGTTTVRIDRETHARLVRMSELAGVSLGAIIREAAEALSRQRFALRVAAESSGTPQRSGSVVVVPEGSGVDIN